MAALGQEIAAAKQAVGDLEVDTADVEDKAKAVNLNSREQVRGGPRSWMAMCRLPFCLSPSSLSMTNRSCLSHATARQAPRVLHALSLYANITGIRWKYDDEGNQHLIRGCECAQQFLHLLHPARSTVISLTHTFTFSYRINRTHSRVAARRGRGAGVLPGLHQGVLLQDRQLHLGHDRPGRPRRHRLGPVLVIGVGLWGEGASCMYK